MIENKGVTAFRVEAVTESKIKNDGKETYSGIYVWWY